MGQPVMRWQILAKDPASFAQFYEKLFGWSVNTDNSLGYREIQTGSDRGIQGGIWPTPPDTHAMVSLYVEVEDVAATVQLATSIGAVVIIPPQTLPDGDEMAVIVGPEGVPFGLMKHRTCEAIG